MPTPADAIAYLANAGLDRAGVMQAVYYLQHGQMPPGATLSPQASQAIHYLGSAGLDAGGVNRAINYLSTGQDPEGDQERAAAAQQQQAAPQQRPDASLAVSPAWLAFRRSLGIQDETDAASTQQQIDALNRRAGLQRGDLLEQGVKARQGIADSHEARGVFRSGARLKAQSEQQSGEGRALGQIEQGLAEGVSGLAAQLAQRRAERQRQMSETGLNVAYEESQRGY